MRTKLLIALVSIIMGLVLVTPALAQEPATGPVSVEEQLQQIYDLLQLVLGRQNELDARIANLEGSASADNANELPKATWGSYEPQLQVEMEKGGSDRSSECPTDTAMQQLFGFDLIGVKPVFTGENIPWEGCSWVLQFVGIRDSNGEQVILNLPMLVDWQFTATIADGAQTPTVWYGDGQVRPVLGSTLRYRPAYNTPATRWVNTPCELLKREYDWGMRRDQPFVTYNGNVSCDSFPHTYYGAPAEQAPQQPAAQAPAEQTDLCPTNPAQATELMGGKNSKWSRPDSDQPRIWKYLDKISEGGELVQLHHPGFGRLEYWNDQTGAATATSVGNLPNLVDEATFKCE